MTTRALPMLELAPAPRQTPAAAVPEPRIAEFVTDDVALPRFHRWTLGCQMNRSDAEEMAGALADAGCAETMDMESADLIVINTCAIREAAEQKVIGRMGHLARLKDSNPALRVVMTGCSVRENNAGTLKRRYPQVDLFLRPDEEPELILRLGLASATAPGRLTTPIRRESAISAWLPVIYGCDKTCTYCIVPFSRGPERSRPFDEILDEARSLAAAGYREITLLGQNVNSYGHDLPPEDRFAGVHGARTLGRRLDLEGRPDIAALLSAIDSLRTADGVPAISRLRFVTSHPWDLSDRLISAIADSPSVCEHLHLPVQSGDDAVLRRMGRQYTVEAYLELVAKLRSAVPEIALTTDVIVGFCGETEEQFENTLTLLREVRYEQVFAAAFSPRPGTPAARLPDDVPRAEKKRRLQALLDLQEGIGLERNLGWVAKTTQVLVDQVRPPSAHGHDGVGSAQRVSGRNRHSKLVHLDGGPELIGQLVEVRIERAGPYALSGSLLNA
ncbi:MAG: tRNA (N6-isopentenyl adenosine(37)-C2)-methylthiotransferase MiaB [Candidatus Limnocylindrales bacterium]